MRLDWVIADGCAINCSTRTWPKKGSLRLAYATFQANDDPALKLASQGSHLGYPLARKSPIMGVSSGSDWKSENQEE
jgi:hypothetical protein